MTTEIKRIQSISRRSTLAGTNQEIQWEGEISNLLEGVGVWEDGHGGGRYRVLTQFFLVTCYMLDLPHVTVAPIWGIYL